MHDAVPPLPGEHPLLALDRLVAGYDRPVVGPLSFHLAPGEIAALWGPNGSGKTTVLNAIGGGAHIFGGSVTRRPGLRVSHQHQSALPLQDVPLCGRELLALTCADARALPDTMKPLLRRMLSELSGGQLQFLQVWACLTAPVDLVLLDEPTNNVDPASIALVGDAIRRVRAERAVLLISHDRDFVEALGARIVTVERQ